MAAAAHGDTGTLELVEQTPVDADSVTFVVELTYEADGDAVSSAEITVTTDNVAPQVMTATGEGRYELTIDFPSPGDYPVVFSVTEPEAELVVQQVIATTTITTAETSPPTSLPLAEQDTEGSAAWLLVLMGVIVVTMVVVAVAFFRGRARRTAVNEPAEDPSNRPST
jgi:hypothetical protein